MTTGPGNFSDGFFTPAETCVTPATLTKSAGRRWHFRSSLTVICLLAAGGLCMNFTPQQVVAADQAPGITQEQADAILQELRSIRELLEQMNIQQARPAPPASSAADPARVSIKDRPSLGASDAPVTVVEFADYECPFCKRFHQTTFNSLSRDYIDTGKVQWIVLDLPLPMHPNASKAAQAAHCAGEQDKFWEMRKLLFGNSPLPGPEAPGGYGLQLGLDQKAFADCLTSDRYLDQIDADSAAAAGIRITGTPSFIVGRRGGDWVEGKKIVGAQSYAVFDSAIRLALADQSAPTD
jgi:protein-disulfide isomerase